MMGFALLRENSTKFWRDEKIEICIFDLDSEGLVGW